MQRSALCRSRRELSNAYVLAKFGFDTAENEPLEVWGKIIQSYSIVSEERRVAPPAAATIWTWQIRNIWIWQFRSICKKRVGKSTRGNPKLAPDVAPQRVRHRVLYVLYRFWSNRFWNSLILSGFRDDSREEWRGSLFQSDVRKQIRKLPKILKVVKIIQYYSIFFFQ